MVAVEDGHTPGLYRWACKSAASSWKREKRFLVGLRGALVRSRASSVVEVSLAEHSSDWSELYRMFMK